jgi:hypothetical protein
MRVTVSAGIAKPIPAAGAGPGRFTPAYNADDRLLEVLAIDDMTRGLRSRRRGPARHHLAGLQ